MAETRGTSSSIVTLAEKNLSHTWARAFLRLMSRGSGETISPLTLSVTSFDEDGMPYEDKEIREALDDYLAAHPKTNLTKTTAFTIFPQQFWLVSQGNREHFYEMCRDAAPRMKARDPRNKDGVYFERLVQFGRGNCGGNQLEYIIRNYRHGVRASFMQAIVFDPERDQSKSAQLGFPCLQSVGFVPAKGGLILNAVYPTQYVVERAYGNLLGLSHLGAFVASEIKLPLRQVNLFVSVERRTKSKASLMDLKKVIKEKLGNELL